MPIYEFTCKKCDNNFDIKTIKCPDCGTEEPEKRVSVFGCKGISSGSASCGTCSSSNCSSCGH
ncbi:MAG: hypothetical protein KAX49_19500 [Halanaerobiales bacterium]|nr:hypothetical protein [Halanaerobiales bacterium]